MAKPPDPDEEFIREFVRRVPEFRDVQRSTPDTGEVFPYFAMSAVFEFFKSTYRRWVASGRSDERARDLLQRMSDMLEYGIREGADSVYDVVVIGFVENMFYKETHDELLEVLGPEVRATLRSARREIAKRIERRGGAPGVQSQ